MERLTNDAINNLLAMSKYDYHMYGLDIKTALSELKECRATSLTPDEVNTIAKSQIATAGHNVELQEKIAELRTENERLIAYRVEITVKPNEDNEYWCPKCGEQIVGYYASYCEYCGQCVELEDSHDKN